MPGRLPAVPVDSITGYVVLFREDSFVPGNSPEQSRVISWFTSLDGFSVEDFLAMDYGWWSRANAALPHNLVSVCLFGKELT